MGIISLTIFLALGFSPDCWAESLTGSFGKPLTEQQKLFLKERSEALKEADELREVELRILKDADFCVTLANHAAQKQETYDDCKKKLIEPILRSYEKWGKTERAGLLLNEYRNHKKETP